MIHLESWERVADGRDGDPPTPPLGDHDNGIQQLRERRDFVRPNKGRVGADEEMGVGAGELDEGRSERLVSCDLEAWSVRLAPVCGTVQSAFGRRSRTALDGGERDGGCNGKTRSPRRRP